MLSRAAFILIALFWVTMNVLLWRTEIGSRSPESGAVPVELVWRRMLTSPDSSSMSILYHGRKIGFCHWITGVGEQWAKVTEENLPDGPPVGARSYRVRIEGSAILADVTNRIRFDGSLDVATNRNWEQIDVRMNIRPVTWQIHSSAAEKTLKMTVQEGGGRVERVIPFSDLENPAALLGQLAGAIGGEWMPEIELPAVSGEAQSSRRLPVEWEAREDMLWIAHAQLRVYRLETQVLDRYRISIFVSRVGELVRIELPDDIVLVNDQLATF